MNDKIKNVFIVMCCICIGFSTVYAALAYRESVVTIPLEQQNKLEECIRQDKTQLPFCMYTYGGKTPKDFMK